MKPTLLQRMLLAFQIAARSLALRLARKLVDAVDDRLRAAEIEFRKVAGTDVASLKYSLTKVDAGVAASYGVRTVQTKTDARVSRSPQPRNKKVTGHRRAVAVPESLSLLAK